MTTWYDKFKIIEAKSNKKSKWITVDSSFITQIKYTEPLEVMSVKLKGGAIYSYTDVPKDVFEDFVNSESKGYFYNHKIKPVYKLSEK